MKNFFFFLRLAIDELNFKLSGNIPNFVKTKRLVHDRRMDRGASSFASMATEDRSKIAREAPPQVVFSQTGRYFKKKHLYRITAQVYFAFYIRIKPCPLFPELSSAA
ncbi:MAG: hypothetical protein IJY46_10270 [Lentisphaeria bacterium]|nr:hypothetical protein [Lentisphaeria bacterium]